MNAAKSKMLEERSGLHCLQVINRYIWFCPKSGCGNNNVPGSKSINKRIYLNIHTYTLTVSAKLFLTKIEHLQTE